MDVLILAAGLGSRLVNFTHNIIPKYLINVDNNTGLYHIINYWDKYADNIYLVINSNYTHITKFYINNILPDISSKIKIINYDTSDGTAYTLNYILNNDLRDKKISNLLITWCDLYPAENIDFTKLSKTKETNKIHVFTNGTKCRYLLTEDNKIIHSEESVGDILGIFYIQNYTPFVLGDYCKNNDIVCYLDIIGKINKFEINSIIDYGDEEKLLQILDNDVSTNTNNNFNCRYFNNISIIDDTKLLKKGINDKGKELIINEKKWYIYLKELNDSELNKLIPSIYNLFEFGFLMEYKRNHIPVYKFFMSYEKYLNNIDNSEINKSVKTAEYNIVKITVLKNIINKINILHNFEKKTVLKLHFFNNLKKEIYDKIYERKKIINDFIDYFGEVKIVNSVHIDTFDNILNKCKNIIVQYYNTIDIYKYSIIFGDCQFSNILINPDNIDDIVFIDPRGYFGDSVIFGPTEYDYAKILYAISGYDNFNSNNFNIKKFDKNNKSLEFEINGFIYDKKIINKYFNRIHKAYLVLIWLSLGEYTKNNTWKCLSSYYYGIYLGTIL